MLNITELGFEAFNGTFKNYIICIKNKLKSVLKYILVLAVFCVTNSLFIS